jgi:hypothetical protein
MGMRPRVRRRGWVFPTVLYDFRLRSEGSTYLPGSLSDMAVRAEKRWGQYKVTMTPTLKGGRCSWIPAVEIREAEMGLAWMSPALGRNVALDFAEFLFESIQTGLDRLLLCDVGCQHRVQESLVGDSGVAR